MASGLTGNAVVDGVSTTYAYDSTGIVTRAITSVNATTMYSYQLERDAINRIIRNAESIGGTTIDTRFTYDSAGRLSAVTRDGSLVATYEYDANSNRTRRTSSAGIEMGSVDAQDRLTSYGVTTYQPGNYKRPSPGPIRAPIITTRRARCGGPRSLPARGSTM